MIITAIFISILRFHPSQWKIAEIVMILKTCKHSTNPSSNRPISLLPTMSKLFEKLLIDILNTSNENFILNHQFGFRERHFTIQQVHREDDVINDALES